MPMREAAPAPNGFIFYPLHDLVDMHYLLHNLPQKRCPCLTNHEEESSRLKRLPEATRQARGKAKTQAHPLLQKNARAGWQRTLYGRFWKAGIIKKKNKKTTEFFFFPDSKSSTRSW